MFEALNIAKNPQTSPQQLKDLLEKHSDDKAVVSAIAFHPNMTKELLIELARNDDVYNDEEEDYFCKTDENPVIDLLLLEHPNLVEDVYFTCFDELPQFYGVDDMATMLSYSQECSSFCYHLPNWFVKIAVQHRNEDLRGFVASRIIGTQEQYVEQLLQDESVWVRYVMASSPSLSNWILEKLLEDEDAEVREAAARNNRISNSKGK